MVLFFIAATLFRDVDVVEKKSFKVQATQNPHAKEMKKNVDKAHKSRFKLMDKGY